MEPDNITVPSQSSRPGTRLKQAREARGWSISQMADRLHVIPRYVKAIEEGDYGELPGLVFLKGYVRSYARLVQLPENELVNALEHDLLVSGEPIGQGGLSQSSDSDDGGAKPGVGLIFGILLVVVVLLGGGYYFWLQASETESSGVRSDESVADDAIFAESAENPPEGEVSPNVPDRLKDNESAFAGSDASDPESDPDISAPAQTPAENMGMDDEPGEISTDNTPPVTPETVTTDAPASLEAPALPKEGSRLQAEGAGGADSVSGDTSTTRVSAQVNEDDIGLGTTSAPNEVSASPSVQSSSLQGSNMATEAKLVANFSGDCWFDIRDANNDRTVGLYRSGDRIEFEGVYPIRMIVGAVSAVSVTVDGNSLDFSNYRIRNNRAEIVLEQ